MNSYYIKTSRLLDVREWASWKRCGWASPKSGLVCTCPRAS